MWKDELRSHKSLVFWVKIRRFKSSKLIYQRWFLWILVVVSGVKIWQHPTFVPISSSLNLWLTLTRTNQIKLKSEHLKQLRAGTGECRKNAIFSTDGWEKSPVTHLTDAPGRWWNITKRISRCISIESLWMQSSFFDCFFIFSIFTHDGSESQSFLAHHSCRKISSLQQHFTDGI